MMVIYWSNMFFQGHLVENIFQNFRVKLKFRIQSAMKVKLFLALEIQFFELRFFLTRMLTMQLVVLLLHLVLLIS